MITLYWKRDTAAAAAEVKVLLQARLLQSHHPNGTKTSCWGLPFGTPKQLLKQTGAATPAALPSRPGSQAHLASLTVDVVAREVEPALLFAGPKKPRNRSEVGVSNEREPSCHVWAFLSDVRKAAANADGAALVAVTTQKCADKPPLPLDQALIPLFTNAAFLRSVNVPVNPASADAHIEVDPQTPRVHCHILFVRRRGAGHEVLVCARDPPQERLIHGAWDLPSGVYERSSAPSAAASSTSVPVRELLETAMAGCVRDVATVPAAVLREVRAQGGGSGAWFRGDDGADGEPFATVFFGCLLDDFDATWIATPKKATTKRKGLPIVGWVELCGLVECAQGSHATALQVLLADGLGHKKSAPVGPRIEALLDHAPWSGLTKGHVWLNKHIESQGAVFAQQKLTREVHAEAIANVKTLFGTALAPQFQQMLSNAVSARQGRGAISDRDDGWLSVGGALIAPHDESNHRAAQGSAAAGPGVEKSDEFLARAIASYEEKRSGSHGPTPFAPHDELGSDIDELELQAGEGGVTAYHHAKLYHAFLLLTAATTPNVEKLSRNDALSLIHEYVHNVRSSDGWDVSLLLTQARWQDPPSQGKGERTSSPTSDALLFLYTFIAGYDFDSDVPTPWALSPEELKRARCFEEQYKPTPSSAASSGAAATKSSVATNVRDAAAAPPTLARQLSASTIANTEWTQFKEDNPGAESKALDELFEKYVGLVEVKTCALGIFKVIHENKLRSQKKPKQAPVNVLLNFAFLGNPGTGKTEVAKIFGRFLHEAGARLGGPPKGSIKPGTVGEATSKEEVEEIKALAAKATPPRIIVFFHHDLTSAPIPGETSAYLAPFFTKWAVEFPELSFVKVDGVQHADIVFDTFAGFPSIYFCKGNTTLTTLEKMKKDAPAAAAGGGAGRRTGGNAPTPTQVAQNLQFQGQQAQAANAAQQLQNARDLKEELKDAIESELKRLQSSSGGSVVGDTVPIFTQTSGQELLRKGGDFFRDMIQDSLNGVIFIDEAHEIDPRANGKAGREISSQLLLASNDHRRELTFILAGYPDDVEKRLLATDPGFGRRFHVSRRIEFLDYTKSQLKKIWEKIIANTAQKVDATHSDEVQGWSMKDDRIAEVVARRIAKGSGRHGFGNAGEVQSQFDIATERALLRDRSTLELEIVDVIGPKPNRETLPYLDAALCELEAYVGLSGVKRDIYGIVELVEANWEKQKALTKPDDAKLNRCFVGNPGTGKTECAKIFGKVLKELGILSNGRSIVIGAQDLIGDAVGVSEKNVKELFARAEGKVVIIDEAYAFDDSGYGKDVINSMLT